MKNNFILFADSKGHPIKIPGKWNSDNLFVPDALNEEFLANPAWKPFALQLTSAFKDAPFMISSVKSDFLGKLRKETSSHMRGFSLDIAPIFTKGSALHPDLKSPRMADDRALALFVALIAQDLPCGVVLEGDHFHIDARYPSGCFLYSTYRREYSNDQSSQWRQGSPIVKRMFQALVNGEIRSLSDDQIIHIKSFD